MNLDVKKVLGFLKISSVLAKLDSLHVICHKKRSFLIVFECITIRKTNLFLDLFLFEIFSALLYFKNI